MVRPWLGVFAIKSIMSAVTLRGVYVDKRAQVGWYEVSGLGFAGVESDTRGRDRIGLI